MVILYEIIKFAQLMNEFWRLLCDKNVSRQRRHVFMAHEKNVNRKN